MGRSGRVMVIAAAAVLLPSGAAAAFPVAPTLPTPDGPMTLVSRSDGASTAEGLPPQVLVGVSVVVGAGGRAGTVAVRAENAGVVKVGPPVTLPAEPGTYRFAAPHISWDYRTGDLGVVQATGGHAIAGQRACTPDLGRFGDPCQTLWLDVATPSGVTQLPGQQLALDGVVETDSDRDLRGDATEDHTDLAVTARPGRGPKRGRAIVIEVRNRGPQRADLPRVRVTHAGGTVRFRTRCVTPSSGLLGPLPAGTMSCGLPPLAVGVAARSFFAVRYSGACGGVRAGAVGTYPAPAHDAATAATG